MSTPRVKIVEGYEELGKVAARKLGRLLLAKPDAALALPTGKTPQPFYKHLVALYRSGLLDFSQSHIFGLDELYGLPKGHPRSFRTYLEERLISRVNLPCDHFHVLPSTPDDVERACISYEREIQQLGGLELAILGIGANGHLAYNEPGTPFHTDTHVAELTQETREELRKTFTSEEPARHALTIGLRTIMRARRVLLLAAGAEKAAIVAKALAGPVTEEIPASVLQLHPQAGAILDHEAALTKR